MNKLLPRTKLIVHDDLAEAARVEYTACPLCNTMVNLFQIHYDEKFLMCGNIDCPYPFGFADYHVYKLECNEEVVRNSAVSGASGSMISSIDWSEIDRLVGTDGLLSPNSTHSQSLVEKTQDISKIEKKKNIDEHEKSLKENVKEIARLNKQLYSEKESPNMKVIKRIAQIQERSGIKLLTQSEFKKVQKTKKEVDMSMLKIDVDPLKKAISLHIALPDQNTIK